MSGFPVAPKHPERVCWGCDKFCPANDLRCFGKERAPHPIEEYGPDWNAGADDLATEVQDASEITRF